MDTKIPVVEFGDTRLPPRFWSKVHVDQPSGCWLWTAAVAWTGYGRFKTGGKTQCAHRVAYSALVEELPAYKYDSLQLDHLCRVRSCVNPSHLERVSPRTNLLRGETHAAINAGKTHCPSGHLLSGDNLWRSALSSGHRACRECSHERASLIREAHMLLGMSQSEYTQKHGKSVGEALRVIDEVKTARGTT